MGVTALPAGQYRLIWPDTVAGATATSTHSQGATGDVVLPLPPGLAGAGELAVYIDPCDDFDGDGLCISDDNCPAVANLRRRFLPGLRALRDRHRRWRASGRLRLERAQRRQLDAWNSYRGDLAELLGGGVYSQPPGSNPLASAQCDVAEAWIDVVEIPEPGGTMFLLVSGQNGTVEGDLGWDSAGAPRAHDNPCP